MRAALSGKSYVESWMGSREFARAAARACENFGPDLVHADTLGLVQHVPERARGRVILNHHNVESHMMLRRQSLEPHMARRLLMGREAAHLRRLEQGTSTSALMNITVSELDSERLGSIAPGARCMVVENGVDTDYFKPLGGLQRRPNRIAFAGGMDWYPNHQAVEWLCNEIWPALTMEGPGWDLVVVGRSPSESLIKLAAGSASVEPTGFVPDVRPFLSSAGIFICPIRDGGGTRLKILDALAMECALVSTRLGVEGLSLKDGQHYLNAETTADFVRQCRRLREDPDLAQRLAREGREYVLRHFSWDVVGGHLNLAYEDALDAMRTKVTAARTDGI